MRKILIVAAALIIASFGVCLAAQTVTKEAEVSTPVTGGNTARARQSAIDQAVVIAAKGAAAELVSTAELERRKNVLEPAFNSNAAGCVVSYKILEELKDADSKNLKLRVIVTFSMPQIKDILLGAGISAQKLEAAKVVILIDERRFPLPSLPDPLMATSLSEEIMAQKFLDKGYTVMDRDTILDYGLSGEAMAATAGDKTAVSSLAAKLHADIIILGWLDLTATQTNTQQENVTAAVNLSLYSGADASLIINKADSAGGTYPDVLTGATTAITSAVETMETGFIPGAVAKALEIKEGRG